jgi:hypothetical protein
MLLCVLAWQLSVLLPLTCCFFGWRIAVLHTLAVMLLSTTLVEALLARFPKIPFTCSTRPDIRRLLMRMLGALFGVMVVVPIVASAEESMLLNPYRFFFGLLLIAAAWYAIVRYRRDALRSQRLIFEDAAPPQFELLKLV